MNKYILKLNILIVLINLIIIINFLLKCFKNIDISFNITKFKLFYNEKFAIIQRNVTISTSGLMAYYFNNIGCAIDYIYNGYIPIIDLSSHPNIFNAFNKTSFTNPWEIFFNQPFGYKLENIIKYAKNIIYVQCELAHSPNYNFLMK